MLKHVHVVRVITEELAIHSKFAEFLKITFLRTLITSVIVRYAHSFANDSLNPARAIAVRNMLNRETLMKECLFYAREDESV